MQARGSDAGARLRALASAAYTAGGGHLEVVPEDDVTPSRRRWLPSLRSAVVAGVTAVVFALAVAAGAWLGRPDEPVPLPATPTEVDAPAGAPSVPATPSDEPAATASASEPADAPSTTGTVVVHVAGAVADPGVVELPGGARVGEAVDAAGGATGEADLGAVNLARVLVDGEQVYVPRAGEAPPAVTAPGAADVPPGAAVPPVNLNTATATDLEELPGIGPALAAAILEWRDLNGGFASVEDLDLVSGIGPATLERLRPLVTV